MDPVHTNPTSLVPPAAVPIFAGVGGGVIGALAAEVSPAKAVGMAVAGAIAGAFVVPGMAELAGIDSTPLISSVSCLVGMLMLQIARLIQRRFDQVGPAILDAALRLRGVGPPQSEKAPGEPPQGQQNE